MDVYYGVKDGFQYLFQTDDPLDKIYNVTKLFSYIDATIRQDQAEIVKLSKEQVQPQVIKFEAYSFTIIFEATESFYFEEGSYDKLPVDNFLVPSYLNLIEGYYKQKEKQRKVN